ncbi:Protein of unknown function [Pedobacter sp. ok626]|nr:Protein of unknown function [Pedobacter sp. ok626]
MPDKINLRILPRALLKGDAVLNCIILPIVHFSYQVVSYSSLMSINNLLAYLIGWGELVLKWNRKKDNNEPVDFPDTGYQWNELGKLVIC